jgi:hypothetical protein
MSSATTTSRVVPARRLMSWALASAARYPVTMMSSSGAGLAGFGGAMATGATRSITTVGDHRATSSPLFLSNRSSA